MEFNGQYLTFEEYQTLGGTLQEMPFNLLEFEARKLIDKYTFNRLVDLEEQNEEVKLCINNLIKEMNDYNSQKNVSRKSVDGYSVTYTNSQEEGQRLDSIIGTYLINCKLEDGTPYLYRG